MADHRIQRAAERYGITITADEIAELEKTLSPKNRIKAHGGEVVHLLKHGGRHVLVAVRRIDYRWVITTFLPDDCFSAKKRRAFRARKRTSGHRAFDPQTVS